MRRAYLTAATARIHCPHCHEEQVHGEDESDEFTLQTALALLGGKGSRTMTCGVCSRQFTLSSQTVHEVLR